MRKRRKLTKKNRYKKMHLEENDRKNKVRKKRVREKMNEGNNTNE